MSGAWSLHPAGEEEPEPRPKCRLRLVEAGGGTAAHLSCMTLSHGGLELYTEKRALLGEDPLRSDADPERLYGKIRHIGRQKGGGRSVGRLLMDQALFAGPGNIYRAEILFLAGVDPDTTAENLTRAEFDRVWKWSVDLLRRGYDTGSILTVDPELDPDAAARGLRRYVYNQSECGRCGGKVLSWDMGGRTCYACGGGCQGNTVQATATTTGAKKKQAKEIVKKRDTKKLPVVKEESTEVAKVEAAEKGTVMEEPKSAEKKAASPLPKCNPQIPPAAGSRVEVYWPDDGLFYPGTITSVPRKRGFKFRIDYDDGEFEVLRLKDETWRYEGDEPSVVVKEEPLKKQHVPFISHCAREGLAKRLDAHGPQGLTVIEIRAELKRLLPQIPDGVTSMPPTDCRKRVQAEALRLALEYVGRVPPVPAGDGGDDVAVPELPSSGAACHHLPPPTVSAEDAAREKAAAGEHRGVEHVAELSSGQAVGATTGRRRQGTTDAKSGGAAPKPSAVAMKKRARAEDDRRRRSSRSRRRPNLPQ